MEMDDNEKINYAKIFKPDTSANMTLEDLSFFPTDYLMRCVEGNYTGRQMRLKELGNEIIIGDSDDCELSIKYSGLDDKHCKLSIIENTIYYTLIDLGSKEGTWKRISNLEDAFEVTNDYTEFKLFDNTFVIEKIKEDDKTKVQLRLTYTTSNQKIKVYPITEECSNFCIGKESCVINFEDLKCSEIHKYGITMSEGRIFITNNTEEITNEGLLYKLQKDEIALLRAGDVFKIGESAFRLLVHNWGLSTELGDKSRQEDKCCIIDDLRLFDEVVVPCYAVYDGHGGATCSIFLQKTFHKNIREIINIKKLRTSKNILADMIEAIQTAIIYTDIQFYKDVPFSANHGSTCVIIFFIANKVICCNLGDSVAILHKTDDSKVFLSKDFKPSRPKEQERIKAKNGFISSQGRLLGTISISRGFGDWRFKDPKPENLRKIDVKDSYDEYLMSNRAEFRIFELDYRTCDYIIVVSDGIFQNTSFKGVFDIINNALKYEKQEFYNSLINVASAADNVRLEIINRSYAMKKKKKGMPTDNMTLILIHLNNDI